MKTTYKITPVVKWVVTKVVEDEVNRSGSATLYGEFPDEATAEQALRAVQPAGPCRDPKMDREEYLASWAEPTRSVDPGGLMYQVLTLKRDPRTVLKEYMAIHDYLDAHPECRADYTPPPKDLIRKFNDRLNANHKAVNAANYDATVLRNNAFGVPVDNKGATPV